MAVRGCPWAGWVGCGAQEELQVVLSHIPSLLTLSKCELSRCVANDAAGSQVMLLGRHKSVSVGRTAVPADTGPHFQQA